MTDLKTLSRAQLDALIPTLDITREQLLTLQADARQRPSSEDVRQWHEDRRRYMADSTGAPWYDDLTGRILMADRADAKLRALGLAVDELGRLTRTGA
jgi:hypothetical protein